MLPLVPGGMGLVPLTASPRLEDHLEPSEMQRSLPMGPMLDLILL
jgi:hypothetical protein